MTITNATARVATTTARNTDRTRARTIVAAGATLFVGATVAFGAIALSRGEAAPRPARPAATAPVRALVDPDFAERDLVERGLIPRQSLEPAPEWHAELVRELAERDLVERGLIPRQSLDPAPEWHAELMRELARRDLVARGLIPRQSLDPAPALASPTG